MTDQPGSQPSSLPSLAFLGAGSMGGAILAGVLASGSAPESIVVTNRSAEKAEALAGDGVVSLATSADPEANRAAVADARLVVVGVKPAMVPDLLREIADALPADAAIVSIAAGVTIATMEALVPNPVLRAMPNTPSFVRRGVTGVAPGSRASDADVAATEALFATVGDVLVIEESRIDALSTISGSGPAYVFLLIEELEGSARRMGFSEEEAARMVRGTFLGASELLAASDVDPAELRRRVTSPKGTTERAVGVLQEGALGELFDRATAAAAARAAELAAG